MPQGPPSEASETIPPLCPILAPPSIRGAAWLAHRAFDDHGLDDLLAAIHRAEATPSGRAGLALDASFAHALRFRNGQAAALQRAALSGSALFRVEAQPSAEPPLRLLALTAPGDLMVNTPLDFITAHLNVRLDLLFVRPGEKLPERLPDHDVAFFAVSESDQPTLRRLAPLYRAWPRPALNDPAAVARLSREQVAAGLAGLPGVQSPPALRLSREALEAGAADGMTRNGQRALVRPHDSHAGRHLALVDGPAQLEAYLAASAAESFFVTRFVDYRSPDGMFRKHRVALVRGRPFLCHMAASEHWMVHYLNAGMTDHADRRMEEAHAMATFDGDFALRHAEALAAVHRWAGLDYLQLDCAEAPDGKLLVFEADTAAIVHLMDAPDLFSYKVAPMRRLFAAFDRMLRDAATSAAAPASPVALASA